MSSVESGVESLEWEAFAGDRGTTSTHNPTVGIWWIFQVQPTTRQRLPRAIPLSSNTGLRFETSASEDRRLDAGTAAADNRSDCRQHRGSQRPNQSPLNFD